MASYKNRSSLDLLTYECLQYFSCMPKLVQHCKKRGCNTTAALLSGSWGRCLDAKIRWPVCSLLASKKICDYVTDFWYVNFSIFAEGASLYFFLVIISPLGAAVPVATTSVRFSVCIYSWSGWCVLMSSACNYNSGFCPCHLSLEEFIDYIYLVTDTRKKFFENLTCYGALYLL